MHRGGGVSNVVDRLGRAPAPAGTRWSRRSSWSSRGRRRTGGGHLAVLVVARSAGRRRPRGDEGHDQPTGSGSAGVVACRFSHLPAPHAGGDGLPSAAARFSVPMRVARTYAVRRLRRKAGSPGARGPGVGSVGTRGPRRAEVRGHVGGRRRADAGRGRPRRPHPPAGRPGRAGGQRHGQGDRRPPAPGFGGAATSAGREMDMLITAGERKATALMCMALHEKGVPAESYTGSQAGLHHRHHPHQRQDPRGPPRPPAQGAGEPTSCPSSAAPRACRPTRT